MSNDAFSQRQQEILLKAALLAAFALILTFRPRAGARLSAPISTMGQAVEAIQSGDYKTSLPILDDGEIGDPPVTSTISPAGWTARAGNRNRRSAN